MLLKWGHLLPPAHRTRKHSGRKTAPPLLPAQTFGELTVSSSYLPFSQTFGIHWNLNTAKETNRCITFEGTSKNLRLASLHITPERTQLVLKTRAIRFPARNRITTRISFEISQQK